MIKSSIDRSISFNAKQNLAADRKIRDLAHKREIRKKTKGKTAAQRMLGE